MTGHRGHVGIVGGGMLGMTLALRLRQAGYKVTILEAAPSVGGLAAPHRVGSYTWDRFYHVILYSDSHLRGLLGEIGLSNRLRWSVTGTGIFIDGELYPLSSAIDFLRFPALSLSSKLRLAATILYASRITDGQRLESTLVTDWLRRLSGGETFERLWLPLLKAKLGDNYLRTSAAFIWAYIARLYAARRIGLKREMFGYVEGGYATILSRLEAHLRRMSIEFVLGNRVSTVESDSSGARVRMETGEHYAFDNVVLTVANPLITRLCPALSSQEHRRLERTVYQGVVCSSVLLKKPLTDFYVTNLADATLPFTGIIEMTAIVDRSYFDGHALVYLPLYLPQAHEYWHRSDAEVEEDFIPALRRIHPALGQSDIVEFEVSRAREVQAIATLDYSKEALPPVKTSVPRLYIVNSSQIVNGTLNVNETVGLVNDTTPELDRLFLPPLRAATTDRSRS